MDDYPDFGTLGAPERSTRLLVDGIEAWLAEVDSKGHRRTPGFHVSSMFEFCPREVALTQRLAKAGQVVLVPAEAPDFATRLTFKIGTAYHYVMQNLVLGPAGMLVGGWRHVGTGEVRHGTQPENSVHLGDEGTGMSEWVYQEPTMRLVVEGVPDGEDWNLVGSTDGIVHLGMILDCPPTGKGLVELKSCSPGIYPHLDAAYRKIQQIRDWYTAPGLPGGWADDYARSHSFQLRCYLAGLQYDRGAVVYLPKSKMSSTPDGRMLPDQPPIKEFPIEADRGPIEAAFEKIRALSVAKDGGSWEGPMPRRVCSSISCPRAQSCAVVNECFADADSF